MKIINDPDELQLYYKDEFDILYKYSICQKIWNYYNNNKELIKQVIDYYKVEDSDDEESDKEVLETDYSSDNDEEYSYE